MALVHIVARVACICCMSGYRGCVYARHARLCSHVRIRVCVHALLCICANTHMHGLLRPKADYEIWTVMEDKFKLINPDL